MPNMFVGHQCRKSRNSRKSMFHVTPKHAWIFAHPPLPTPPKFQNKAVPTRQRGNSNLEILLILLVAHKHDLCTDFGTCFFDVWCGFRRLFMKGEDGSSEGICGFSRRACLPGQPWTGPGLLDSYQIMFFCLFAKFDTFGVKIHLFC